MLTTPRRRIDSLAAICDFILHPVTSDPYLDTSLHPFLIAPRMARDLRCTTIMEAIQSYPNLLSEKQAAARLGVARITLLRAREAGRIRFFRIGTRVLYCQEQLTEFLTSCERNGGNDRHGPGRVTTRRTARRKDNQVSPSRRSVSASETTTANSARESSEVDQASLPFSTSR